jgi:hypothetical protein
MFISKEEKAKLKNAIVDLKDILDIQKSLNEEGLRPSCFF